MIGVNLHNSSICKVNVSNLSLCSAIKNQPNYFSGIIIHYLDMPSNNPEFLATVSFNYICLSTKGTWYIYVIM